MLLLLEYSSDCQKTNREEQYNYQFSSIFQNICVDKFCIYKTFYLSLLVAVVATVGAFISCVWLFLKKNSSVKINICLEKKTVFLLIIFCPKNCQRCCCYYF